jgi:hypothetical protein
LPFWTFRKGLRDKTNDESDVHLPFAAAPPQKTATCFILFYVLFYLYRVFGRFVSITRGVQKHEKTKVQKFQKSLSGLITKNVAFFPPFLFFYSLGCFARFFFVLFLGVS